MPKKFKDEFAGAWVTKLIDTSRAIEQGERLVRVPLSKIHPNPKQPRRHFDQTALEDLASSIQAQGILEPLVARDEKDGTYTLIAGERRLRAATLANLESVPVIVRECSDADLLAVALIENMQRRDLHPVDEVRALGDFASQHETQTAAAQALGLSRSTLAGKLRALTLGEDLLNECAQIADLSELKLRELVELPASRRSEYLKTLRNGAAEPTSKPSRSAPATHRQAFAFRAKTGDKSTFSIRLNFRRKDYDLSHVRDALARCLEHVEQELAKKQD